MTTKFIKYNNVEDTYFTKDFIYRGKDGKIYKFPKMIELIGFESKFNQETGEIVRKRDKNYNECPYPTFSELGLKYVETTQIGVVFTANAQEAHDIALKEFGVDIDVKFFEEALYAWIYNTNDDKKYINVNNEFFLFSPMYMNAARVDIFKYFPECGWMNW